MSDKKSKIYTRTGDEGKTGLLGGARVDKSSIKVAAYGEIDEFSASLSVVLCEGVDDAVGALLEEIISNCFALGAEIASDEKGKAMLTRKIGEADIVKIEKAIDKFDAQLPTLTHFITPGKNKTASLLNLARTVCRRAERSVVALNTVEQENPFVIKYLNRVSDMLFVLMRHELEKQPSKTR